ncbi:MAG TPA: hypothetical protein VF329_09820 [Gammaproteobacteria bacterium]
MAGFTAKPQNHDSGLFAAPFGRLIALAVSPAAAPAGRRPDEPIAIERRA